MKHVAALRISLILFCGVALLIGYNLFNVFGYFYYKVPSEFDDDITHYEWAPDSHGYHILAKIALAIVLLMFIIILFRCLYNLIRLNIGSKINRMIVSPLPISILLYVISMLFSLSTMIFDWRIVANQPALLLPSLVGIHGLILAVVGDAFFKASVSSLSSNYGANEFNVRCIIILMIYFAVVCIFIGYGWSTHEIPDFYWDMINSPYP
jgi:preprotein translocase subunit SecG